jgi:hypothetical protein
MAFEHGLHGGTGRVEIGERTFGVHRCEARRQVEGVALPQGHLQLLAQPFDNPMAGGGASGLDEGQEGRVGSVTAFLDQAPEGFDPDAH